MSQKTNQVTFTASDWAAIGTASLTMGAVGGPLAAGATAIGGAAGLYGAKKLGWGSGPEDESNSDRGQK